MYLAKEVRQRAENAVQSNRLVGNTVFSDDEYEALLEYTRDAAQSGRLLSRSAFSSDKDERVHFVTLVEMTKRWKLTDDGIDDSRFWPYILKTLIGAETHAGLYKAFTETIRRLHDTGNIVMANVHKKYYATLMIHAFAPPKSVREFLNLSYNLYKYDLDFNYTQSDRFVCEIATDRFCEIVQSSVGNDRTVSIGSNAYGILVGLRSLALNNDTRADFVALLDTALKSIHTLFYRQTCKAETYFEKMIDDWWQTKRRQVGYDRRMTHKTQPAVPANNVVPKFMYDNGKVSLAIPPIRLGWDKSAKVHLDIFVGNACEPQESKALSTKTGELTITTRQEMLELNSLMQSDEVIHLRVKITDGAKVLCNKTMDREFILFDGENEVLSHVCKVNNYFVYTRMIDQLSTPAEISTVALNVYNIYPKAGEKLSGTNRQVLFVDKTFTANKNGVAFLLESLPNCEWRFADTGCSVYSGMVRLLLPSDAALNGLKLNIDNKPHLVSTLKPVQEDDYLVFDITDRIPTFEPVILSLYSHRDEKVLFKERIAFFPNLRVKLAKSVFYGDDEKILEISDNGINTVLHWDNTQNEIVCPLRDGELIVSIPYIKWRIDDKPWHNAPLQKIVWYKKLFHNGSLLEIDSPFDGTKAELIAVLDGEPETIERNKTNGKFEIGRYIYANEHKTEIVFALSGLDNLIDLFAVSTEEHFIANPLVYSGGKLLWQVEDSFVGDENRQFSVNFSATDKKIIIKDRLTSDDSDIEDISDGVYAFNVSSKGSGLFTTKSKVFYKGEIIVGQKEKFLFANKCIKLVYVSGELTQKERSKDYWKQFKFEYFIDNIQFVENDDDKHYIGKLYCLDKYGEKIHLNKMQNELDSYDRVNPVRIDLVTDNTCEINAGYSTNSGDCDLGGLIYDREQESLCNINLKRDVKGRYFCINYYKFRVEQ
ncbi:MAG: hypothetical protein FWC40_00865 [Proteobacteria bacterium]|nr:hypothetical protein [Pseudomonadota bacterium]